MSPNFWATRDFWGATLKYLGVAVTAVFGLIGTVWETRRDSIRDDRSTEKRLTPAGRALVGGIVISMFVGGVGVWLEEQQKDADQQKRDTEARAATKARDDAARVAGAQLDQLHNMTDLAHSSAQVAHDSAMALENLVKGEKETKEQLTGLTTRNADIAKALGKVTSNVERLKYPPAQLQLQVTCALPDADPALKPMSGNAFFKTASDKPPTPLPDLTFLAFVRGVIAKRPPLILEMYKPGGKAFLLNATTMMFPSNTSCVADVNNNCLSIGHDLKRHRTLLMFFLPVNVISGELPNLLAFGGKELHISGTDGLSLQQVRLRSATQLELRITRWQRHNHALVAKLPVDIDPDTAKESPHWKPFSMLDR
ncbi:MAG TPA: hypothetical protein VGJ81_21520 [Thermoanaerobaculia bacterium]|jgi:hypothetical protein